MGSGIPRELTPREIEVLRLVSVGYSDQEISEILIVGISTIKAHVSRMLSKLSFKNRMQLAIFSYQLGMVDPMSIDLGDWGSHE